MTAYMETLTEKELNTIFDDTGLYVVTKSLKKSVDAHIDILKRANSHDQPVIFLLFHEPYKVYRKRLKNHHISLDNIYFIDLISKEVGANTSEHSDEAKFLESPDQLTNIGALISAYLQKHLDEDALIVIDSLQAINAYNSVDSIKEFINNTKDRAQTIEKTVVAFNNVKETNNLLTTEELYFGDDIEYLGETPAKTTVIQDEKGRKAIVLPPVVEENLGWDVGTDLIWSKEENKLQLEEKNRTS